MSAPGVGVYAAIAKGFDFAGGGGTPTCDPLPGLAQPGWCQVDGTSFAAPIAAAAAAWVWSARRGLTPFQLADVLREGARPGNGQVGGYDAHFGFGLVDVTRSLQAKPLDARPARAERRHPDDQRQGGLRQGPARGAARHPAHVQSCPRRPTSPEDYEDVYRVDVPRGAKRLKVALRHRGSGRRTDDLNVCVWASTVRYVQVEDAKSVQGAARLLEAEGRDVRLADDQAEARHAARVRRRLRADDERVRRPLHAHPVAVVAPCSRASSARSAPRALGPIVGARAGRARAAAGRSTTTPRRARPCSSRTAAACCWPAARSIRAPGLWDLPGGFCEPGETPEEGAVRELREETGADIELTGFLAHLVDTYGDGGDATLNCVFRARLVGDPVLTAADDVAELRWFGPDELPAARRRSRSRTPPRRSRRWRDA